MAHRYEFEPHAIFMRREEADPQIIGEALEELSRANGGRLKPLHGWEAARKRGHPFHRHVQWDEKIAAKAYQLDQVSAIIRSVRVVSEDDARASVRAYHSISDDGRAYHHSDEIATSTSLQLALLQAGLRDLAAWERRYQSLASVCPLVKVARMRLQRDISSLQDAQKPTTRKKRGTTHESRPAAL